MSAFLFPPCINVINAYNRILLMCSVVQSCPTLCDKLARLLYLCNFSSQECWMGALFPTPGDLPDPGIEPTSLMSLALADGFFTSSATSDSSKLETIKQYQRNLLSPEAWLSFLFSGLSEGVACIYSLSFCHFSFIPQLLRFGFHSLYSTKLVLTSCH